MQRVYPVAEFIGERPAATDYPRSFTVPRYSERRRKAKDDRPSLQAHKLTFTDHHSHFFFVLWLILNTKGVGQKTETNEIAVMVDSRWPLIADVALDPVELKDYWKSWRA